MSEQNGTSFIFLTAVSRPYADLPSPYKLSDRLHAMRYRSLMRSCEGSRVQLIYGFHAGDQTPYPRFFSAHLRMRLDSPPGPIAGLRSPVASGYIPHLTLGSGIGSAKILGISGG